MVPKERKELRVLVVVARREIKVLKAHREHREHRAHLAQLLLVHKDLLVLQEHKAL
jgi:hypothetical protein